MEKRVGSGVRDKDILFFISCKFCAFYFSNNTESKRKLKLQFCDKRIKCGKLRNIKVTQLEYPY